MKIIGRRYGDTKKCLKNIWHVDEPRIKDIFWLSLSHINFCWVREALVLPKAFHSYRQFCLTKERRLNHPKSTQDAMKRFRTGDLWVKFAWKLYHKSQLFYIILRSLKKIFSGKFVIIAKLCYYMSCWPSSHPVTHINVAFGSQYIQI